MKVLLVTGSWKNAWPYLPELKDRLEGQGVQVEVLDLQTLTIGARPPAPRRRKIINAVLYRLPALDRFLKTVRSRKLLRSAGPYDAVNIHYPERIYAPLMDELRRIGRTVSVTFWGSDFYRVSEETLSSYDRILDKTDFITFNNFYTLREFAEKKPRYNDKLGFTGFGIGMFEVIRRLQASFSREEIRRSLGLPQDRYVVAVGYNGSPEQQHRLLLDQLERLSAVDKGRIHLLLQFTYGATPQYRQSVAARLERLGIPHSMFTDFADMEQVARMRIASDIVLNAQMTDSFSGSLQEHILSGGLLIVGDWLPYQILDDIGVYYLKSREDGFGSLLSEAVAQYDLYQQRCAGNDQKIYNQSGWGVRIANWIRLYQGSIGEAAG